MDNYLHVMGVVAERQRQGDAEAAYLRMMQSAQQNRVDRTGVAHSVWETLLHTWGRLWWRVDPTHSMNGARVKGAAGMRRNGMQSGLSR